MCASFYDIRLLQRIVCTSAVVGDQVRVLSISLTVQFCQGKNYMGAPGRFCPRNAKQSPQKLKREPLKIAIDCNVKACSMLQI